ncbi:hypothetical protein WOLCODRAFT_86414 [Wolfiporia cocos MD-104 SS10]|uniref:Uncharacterized protein n=1 Tax=Wolfiporia cocos (strain MD-104) TaxID=742152 RepID=A0A2H3JNA6_WOLCO|nr:hypothetical protein WOLCODRAFT_86414 [Wolfiporia cocos MD-104 SS10]
MSRSKSQSLLDDVLFAPDFELSDLRGLNVGREWERVESSETSDPEFSAADGWNKSSVTVRLPKEKEKWADESEAPQLEVPDVYHRSLLDIIKTVCRDPEASSYQWIPYKQFWRRPKNSSDGTVDEESAEVDDIRVYSELFNSDAMLLEYEKIRSQPLDPDDPPDTEVAIVPIMLWSDSTHLASFGSASLWPIYAFFGFISKYIRNKPTSFCAHHLAYVPSLPDFIQDKYQSLYDTAATADVLRFCKRELMNAIWLLILDPEFMKAYEHGILEKCGDGILRRLFPRFFTYSADYPEKILLACIRYLAQCPCPRCLIQKADISEMGTPADMERRNILRVDTTAIQNLIDGARRSVFRKGFALNSKKITKILDPKSLVTTRSAFSQRLSKFGFNFYSMFVPDLLHEFELGVWKAVFTHLLRILYAEGKDRIQILNKRYGNLWSLYEYAQVDNLGSALCPHLAAKQFVVSRTMCLQ